MDLDQTKHGWRCTLTKIWPRISPCSPLWFRKSKVRCCSSAAVPLSAASSPGMGCLEPWFKTVTRLEVPKRGEERADGCTEEIHQKIPRVPQRFPWRWCGQSRSPPPDEPWSKSGDNAQTNVGAVGIFKGMLKMKLVLESAWFNFGVRKLVFGIWAMCHFPSISDGHFHHYYLLIMLFSCTNPHIVACLIFVHTSNYSNWLNWVWLSVTDQESHVTEIS